MKNKNMYYLLAAVIIVIIIAVLLLRKPAPAAPETQAPTAPETPAVQAPETPTTYEGEANAIANVVCAGGKIGGKLTNIGATKVTIGNELKVLLRGMVVKDPGCDKTALEPGESTTCTAMNGPFKVISGQNEIVVRITGAKESQATVTCE